MKTMQQNAGVGSDIDLPLTVVTSQKMCVSVAYNVLINVQGMEQSGYRKAIWKGLGQLC